MVVNPGFLQQPDEVSKTEPWPGKCKVLFAATSHHFPSHLTRDMEEPQTTVSPSIGIISVAHRWSMLDAWLLLYPTKVKHLWFQ